MFRASREKSKHKRRENKISVGLLLCAEVAKVCLGPQMGIWQEGWKRRLGTPRFIKTRFKVLFSLWRLLAKADLMKPLDFFYLVETWGRRLKCFQVFLASEKTQESFQLAGGLYARLRVRQHLLPSQAAWAAGEFVLQHTQAPWELIQPGQPTKTVEETFGDIDKNHPRLCCQSIWQL